MAFLKYLKKKATILPNPDGVFSECMPSAAISSANNEVKDLVNAVPSDSRKRGLYHNYTDEERAQIPHPLCKFNAFLSHFLAKYQVLALNCQIHHSPLFMHWLFNWLKAKQNAQKSTVAHMQFLFHFVPFLFPFQVL